MSIVAKPVTTDKKVPDLVLGDPAKDIPLMHIVPDIDVREADGEDEDEDEVEEQEEDLLFDVLMDTPESPRVLDFILQELALEVHELKKLRISRKDSNMSTTQISARRVDALKKIGDIWLKKKEVTKKTSIDVRSAEFQTILTSLLDKINHTLDESGFSKEMKQVFFMKLSSNLKTWEEELVKITSKKNTEAEDE